MQLEENIIKSVLNKLIQSTVMPSDLKIQYTATLSITDKDYNKISTLIEIKALSRLKYSQSGQYKEILSFLQPLMEEQDFDVNKIFQKFLATIPFEYKLKDRMKCIHKLELVKYQGVDKGEILADQKFRPKQGQITVVQFWASWSGFCRTNIQQNLDILNKYQNIIYVAISLDDKSDEHYEGMKHLLHFQSNPLQIIHYRFQDGWNTLNVHIRGLNIEGIPYILLIDENQQINYKGHPKELEKHLEDLTKDKQKYSKTQNPQAQQQTQEADTHQSAEQINKASKIILPPIQSEIYFQLNQASKVQDSDQKISQIDLIKQSIIQDRNLIQKQEESDSDEDYLESKNSDEQDKELIPQEVLDKATFASIKFIFNKHLKELVKDTIQSKGLEIYLREIDVFWKNQKGINNLEIERSKLNIKNQLPQSQKDNMTKVEQGIKSKFDELETLPKYDQIVSITGNFIDDKKQISTKITDLFEAETKFLDNFHYSYTLHINQDRVERRENNGIVVKQNPDINQVISCKQIFDEFIKDFDQDGKQYGQDKFNQILQACYLKPGRRFIDIQEYENEEGERKITYNPENLTIIYYFNKDLTIYLQWMINQNKQRQGKQYIIHAINLDSKQDKSEDNTNFNNSTTSVYSIKNKEKNPYQFDNIAYGQIECPYYIVIDKEGIILRNSRITSDSNYIELFFSEENLKIPKQQSIVYHQFDYNELVNQICRDNPFGTSSQFQIELTISVQKSLKTNQEQCSCDITYTIRDFLEPELNKRFKGFEDKIQILKNQCKIIQTYQIMSFQDNQKSCNECQIKISMDVPQYNLKFKDKYFCCACAEKLDESNRFLKKDILIFINAPLSNVNILEQHFELGSDQYRERYCNGCGDNEKIEMNATYVCITCPSDSYYKVRFCQECFNKLKLRDSTEYKEIIEKNKHLGMTEDFLLERKEVNQK